MLRKKESYKTGEKALTPAQQRDLLAVIDKYRDEVLIKLALALGCRRADIVRIEWANINYSDNSIAYLEKKKGDNPHTAFAGDEVMAMLKKWQNITDSEYLFRGEKGNSHMADKTAYNILNTLLEKAGIIKESECYPFHALRATCVKNCQRQGWSEAETAAHINDSIEVIHKHYQAPSMNERQQVAREKPIV